MPFEVGYCLTCNEEILGNFAPFLLHKRCGEPCAVIHYPNEDRRRELEFMGFAEVDQICRIALE